MFAGPGNVRAVSRLLPLWRAVCHRRAVSTLAAEILQATSPTAERLRDSGVWRVAGRGSRKTRPVADRSRVNIVEEKLCDDILQYIGPTLDRHVGCDLIDLYPGAGLWSRKLHEVLRPRCHVLMEPDAEFYRPLLAPLMAKPNTKLLPESGIVWQTLNETLAGLPHQTPVGRREPGVEPRRNDTLLITANLATFPRRRFHSFDSVSLMVLYQFLSSIRFSTLAQRYGLVRMLLWVPDRDKRPFLPQCVQARRRAAINAELSCEWLVEVAGLDIAERVAQSPRAAKINYVRDKWIDRESGVATLRRMDGLGVSTPSDRETQLLRELRALDLGAATDRRLAGAEPVLLARRQRDQALRDLEAAHAEESFAPRTKDYLRLCALRSASRAEPTNAALYADLLAEMAAIASLRESLDGNPDPALLEREEHWNSRIRGLREGLQTDFRAVRDNLHAFRQPDLQGPVLLWDRRHLEPLAVRPAEFFPNVACSLLDVQPKAAHALLLQTGPGTSRAGDLFELLLGALISRSVDPLSRVLDRVWPGAADSLLASCGSLTDRTRGGMPGAGYGELCPRILNEEQWTELLAGWMAWPFRPSYVEAVGRLADGDAVATDAAAD